MPLQTCDCQSHASRCAWVCYAKGLRELLAIVGAQNSFESIADLAHRVPELRRNELVRLASIGALNSIGCSGEDELTGNTLPGRKTALGSGCIVAMRYGR